MSEFRRKINYSDKVIKRINEIREACDDILFIPNENCIKGYYRGLVLFDKITDRCENLVKRVSGLNWDNDSNEILNIVGSGMPRDKERRTQQIIAQNNMSFKKNEYSVCGFETVIPKQKVPNKKGNPEIDLVVINPSEKRLLLVEYKCKGSSMLQGSQSIEKHYRDYSAILHSDTLPIIKEEMIKAYRLLCRINGIDTADNDFIANDYKVNIAFLFVDRVIGNDGRNESSIKDSEYEKAMEKLESMEEGLKDVLYIRSDDASCVRLNNWKSIAGSMLR